VTGGNQNRAWRQRYGPWALVTGASDGIGRAMALEAAARGLHLVLVARRVRLLDDLAVEVSQRHRVQARVVAADLGSQEGLAAVLDATASIDVGLMAACAGLGTSGWFTDSDRGRELHMLDVNCRAVLLLTHHFAGRLATRGHGGLVLMSSLVAFQGVPRAAHYAATKAYVQTLAEGLHQELAPQGVDVLASAPGPVASGFASVARMTMGPTVSAGTVARQTLNALGRRTTVRPGALSRLLEGSLATLPRALRVRVMARVMAGMTRENP
jgi:short-subunit dehydrogenase